MTAFILLKLFLFFIILFIFGWQLARFLLGEKRIEALIPLAAALGVFTYIFSLNSLSYLIDIRVNFYLLLIIFIFSSYCLYRINKKKATPIGGAPEWRINKKWRRILFATCLLVMIPAGIIGLRDLTLDQLSINHLLLTSTIMEGNFPVRVVFSPDSPSQYHYGYNLFSAAMAKITNMPIWLTKHFFSFILAGITFLLGFLLIKDFLRDNFRAYAASLVMIFGGNLYFLYALEGLFSDNFRFLNDMIFGKVMRGGLVAQYFHSDWVILGFALTLAIIYLYFRAISDERTWLKISLLAGIMLASLALSAELFFGTLAAVLLIYPLIYMIFEKDWRRRKSCLKISLIILFLGLAISAFQGGIITQTIKQTFFDAGPPAAHRISITPEYLFRGLVFAADNVFIPIFSATFFLGWGWMIIFIAPAITLLFIKHFQLGLFLSLLILISFSIPLAVTAGFSQGDFTRVNLLAALFWNLIFGFFLGWLPSFFKKRWQRLLIIILILAVVFQGLSYYILFSVFLGRGGERVLKPNLAEIEAINWIKKHTAINDYFLTFGGEPPAILPNARFILYAGRFAPSFFQGPHLKAFDLKNEKKWYQKVLEECDPAALKTLNYRYLYVNEQWPEGLEKKCLANNNLELQFEVLGRNNLARIYKIHDDF